MTPKPVTTRHAQRTRTQNDTSGVTLSAGRYQALPDMPPEQFEALQADIAERGVLTPIDVDETGAILDGHHRYRACVALGLHDFPTVVRVGLSEDEKRAFARKSNALRRHLTRAQVRLLVADQLRDTPHWANNRIGTALGVDSKTVATVRARLEATSEIPKLERLIGEDGKSRPTTQPRPPAVTAATHEDLSRILARLATGEPWSGDGPAGFLSADTFMVLSLPAYNPFDGLPAAQVREWERFAVFLADGRDPSGAAPHVEWIVRHDFTCVAEWLGAEGDAYRRRVGMRGMPASVLRAWATFAAEAEEQAATA
jgi:hypothetical protein